MFKTASTRLALLCVYIILSFLFCFAPSELSAAWRYKETKPDHCATNKEHTGQETKRIESEPQFDAEEVEEDLAVLASGLKRLHPSLDLYMSEKDAFEILDQAVSGAKTELTETELLAHVSRVLAKFKCLHLSARPSVKSTRRAMANHTLLPFGVAIAEGRIVVVRDLTENSVVSAGTEILAINNRSSREIIAFMSDRQAVDGFSASLISERIEPLFLWNYRWSYGPSKKFKLLIRKHGREKTIVVKGINYETRQSRRKKRYPSFSPPSKQKSVVLNILEDKIARLKISRFYEPGRDGDWFKTRFAETFKTIQTAGIRDLIIDVRDNPGGLDESPADLFAHLAEKPFPTYQRLSRVATNVPETGEFKLALEDFSEYAKVPAHKLEGLGNPGGLGALLDHYISSHPLVGATWQPAKKRYRGRVWVLINGRSGSSGAEFPAYVKRHRRGTLIGTETCGGYGICTAGILPEIILPNSRIHVRIPLIRYKMMDIPANEVGRGVRPDIEIRPRVKEILSGKDGVMERTMKLIHDARQKK